MKFSRLICSALSAVILCSTVMLGGCDKKTDNGKTLRVGVVDDIAKMGLKNSVSGTFSGFEIDLAQKLCDELGYKDVEFVIAKGTAGLSKLDDGSCDVMLSSCAYTDNRGENYDYSQPYMHDDVRILAELSTCFDDISDLVGCTIAVSERSDSAQLVAQYMADKGIIDSFDADSFDAAQFNDKIKFKVCKTYAEALRKVESGECDAMCDDSIVLEECMSSERFMFEDKIAVQNYVAYTKKGSDLSDDVNSVVTKLSDNGTLQKMKNKYHLLEDDDNG